ncbi:MAG: hypothetical protein ACLTW9_14905 [Enterocloster sp.]
MSNITKMPEDFLRRPQIDGANFRQKLFYTIIPYLKPTFAVLAMLTVTNGLRLFDSDMGHDPGRPRRLRRHDILYLHKGTYKRGTSDAGTAASVILMLIMAERLWWLKPLSRRKAGQEGFYDE